MLYTTPLTLFIFFNNSETEIIIKKKFCTNCLRITFALGELAEWSIAAVLKTVEVL